MRAVLVLIWFIVVAAAGPGGCDRSDASRPSAAVAPPARDLVRRIFDDQAERVTRRQAEEDLDQLAGHLEHEHAYSALEAVPGGTDYRPRLKAIREGLGQSISRSDFMLQVSSALAASGDGHAMPEVEPLAAGAYAPFLCAWSAQGLVAFKPNRSGFLDPARPILVSMDGVPIERWIGAAERVIPRGSPQMVRDRAARALRYIGYLRRELDLPAQAAVEVELAAAGAAGAPTRVSLPLAAECPRFGVWPPKGQFLTATDLVYLRIPEMSDDGKAVGAVREWMGKGAGRRGIIIDVRGNGGGSRAIPRVLVPMLMARGSEPRIVNAAAPRRRAERDALIRDLSDRWLYPASWEGWSPAERLAIDRFAGGFKPEPSPGAPAFGAWHYSVVSPGDGAALPPVVVLMDSGCFSATDVFLASVKGLPGVTLMGTPSSGGSGAARSVKLNHSGLRLNLSSMASFQPDGRLFDGRGVQPDVVVEPAPEDHLGAGDAALFGAADRLLGR